MVSFRVENGGCIAIDILGYTYECMDISYVYKQYFTSSGPGVMMETKLKVLVEKLADLHSKV